MFLFHLCFIFKIVMVANLRLKPLEDWRRTSRFAFLYKILHQEVAVPTAVLGITRNTRASRGLYTKDKLFVPRCNTTELKNHFVARSIPEWNKLRESVTSAGSAQDLKSKLKGLPCP